MRSKEKVIDKCRLCQNIAELSNSHIVSQFLLRESGVIGDKKKFNIICPENPKESELYRQDGIKERLLCTVCETKRLSPVERYAREKFYGRDGPFQRQHAMGYRWIGLDYTRMKLFTLSILWRMSLSSHQFYGNVQLGEKHERRIRSMLLNNDPQEAWRYGCSIGFLFTAANL